MFHRIQTLLAHFQSKTHGAREARQAAGHGARSIMPSSEVRASMHEDGVVFLHLRSGIVFRSNRIGAAIWKGLGNRQDLAVIASEIGSQYDIPVEQAALDAAGFVAQLEAQGFLVRHAGG